ncbi:fatty acid desaturase [Actinomycetospora soli]|uniref:fatty acid desaturase n=1 Tax=Actinomycetospora soli TaxID=2893887 RepID=UPI001E402955|nr:fatty acid desaturase [Actinomycetospora soli]MCD2189589.1 fatty acid desaturase [Actinomycetospora soli]
MTTTAEPADDGRVLSEEESRAIRRGVPHPRVPMPVVALPTLALFVGSLAAWLGATWWVLAGDDPWRYAVTIPVHAIVTFTMFTVLHETIHLAGGRSRRVNEVLGRLAMPFVVAWAAFPLVRFLHIEHHRNTNEDVATDPDAWSTAGPSWQWPLRWMTLDLWYLRFYAPRIPSRPRAELAEQAVVSAVVIGGFVTLALTGHGWELLMIYLVPQRIGVGILVWWFDWLPHHGLEATARSDRFHATRIRVGWERVMNPLFLYQNYHLVHHIHPTIPFYRYVQVWRRSESDFLERDVPIATAWGTELSASEYRAWRSIISTYDRDADLPRLPHRLRVEEVRRLTPDAVSVTFAVPDELREAFRFRPGQHVTVAATIDGEPVRRNYSICTAAGSGVLRIAVRRVEGGRFSTWAHDELRAGDELEVTPPAGSFTLDTDRRNARHVAAIAAGSGITPVISILTSTLDAEPRSRATLLYANRDAEHTMFADELAMLERRYEGRLTVVHHHSRASSSRRRVVPGRLDAARLAEHLGDPALRGAAWFLCGPVAMLDDLEPVLAEHDVTDVRRELFVAPDDEPGDLGDIVPATVAVTCGGETTEVVSTGTASLLESALAAGVDAPYLCAGGICGTCVATVTGGRVHMQQNYALSTEEIAAGRVLTCQSRPTTPEVAVDYDR